ncbi:S8 family serine peptidase [Galbitalea sp. SE-J8]|uniref:S8 family serine peptidase n=1 Tax=Galbitalea sp. SE-J8 TaxID=3054952 RepID=UPI00259CF62B|nr:S8 family serine peptidase [Galbitalea sp. SE-J8]MDM4761401.1 S8 family serine peptidase [Galbitalea sp. SE-J8]
MRIPAIRDHEGRGRRTIGLLAAAASAALIAATVSVPATAATTPSSSSSHLTPSTPPSVGAAAATAADIKAGLPSSGTQAFLVQLDTASTLRTFTSKRTTMSAAKAAAAAKSQLATVTAAQKALIAQLPKRASVLYRTHSVLAAVAVTTDVADFDLLSGLKGVRAVYPIVPKSLDNSSAVPLQGAPSVWQNVGVLGAGEKIAIVDTGIDYTHANFGGPGTTAAYDTAHAAEASAADPALFPSAKVIGGYDLVGDSYDADPASDTYQPTPHPDPNPLDCNDHGSHVAGSAAGYGENADGSTYTGSYGTDTPFGDLKIGPGMAPEASLLAYRVFGCDGSSDVVAEAIDMAVDPNGDGDPSDHADVINMSLGSDFGSALEGDAVIANEAVALGVNVVVASGNAGDATDIGGSPGNASKVITVANSQDASSVIDGVRVTIDGADHTFGVTRSVLYDWDADPDLAGTVVLPPADNTTACSAYPAGTFASDEIPLITWTDDALECGSIARGANLRAAGAGGFIFANSNETFSAGISGDTEIPGVLVVKSGGDAIRAALEDDETVTVSGTSVNTVTQDFPQDDDKINSSSSRGVHAAGNVKPDVSAVGTSVFSSLSGSGDDGASFTGTSMATPMVAGLTALVRAAHPGWSAEQVKAAIVTTATQDISENGSAASDPGEIYAPARAGAGRIEAAAAVGTQVLAYSADDPSVASISFGPVEVSSPVSLTKDITVENTGTDAVAFDVAYTPITTVPGAAITATPATITVAPGATSTVAVTFAVAQPATLAKSFDPTRGTVDGDVVYDNVSGDVLQYLAEASGRVDLAPQGDGYPLRVPVYAAPRPTSSMTQPSALNITDAPTQTLSLPLTGTPVASSGALSTHTDDVASIGGGFELLGTDGEALVCSDEVTVDCALTPDDRAGDIAAVGYATDGDLGYFAIQTHGVMTTPANKSYIFVDLDTDGDGQYDAYLYNGRLTDGGVDSADVFVSWLCTSAGCSGQYLNGLDGSIDTAVYDTDTIVLPFSLAALAGLGVDASHPRVSWAIESYGPSGAQTVDTIWIDPATFEMSGGPTVDLFAPGVSVVDAGGYGPLVYDRPSALTVSYDAAAYAADDAEGVMMVHLHNAAGAKTQLVSLEPYPAPTAPAATTAPTISGTFVAGEPLTADPGAWTEPAAQLTFAYQWLGNGDPIAGATTATYTPPPSSVGESISVRVTATSTASGLSGTATSAAQSISATMPALANTALPTITGTRSPGHQLRATTGTWNIGAPPLTFTYQWTRNGAAIPAATGSSFTVPISAVGTSIGVVVTAHLADAAVSAASVRVVPKWNSRTTISIKDATLTTRQKAKVTVKVNAAGSGKETGTVVLHYGGKTKKVVLHARNKGKHVFTLPKLKKGSYTVWAEYRGSSTVAADNSIKKKLKVRRVR